MNFSWERTLYRQKSGHTNECISLFVVRKKSVITFVNTLRPRRNEQHFADDIFKRIFFNENVWILIKISLKFVPKGPIYSIPALVQIMAWRRSGDKPLFVPMMVSLPTHIYASLGLNESRSALIDLIFWRDPINVHVTNCFSYLSIKWQHCYVSVPNKNWILRVQQNEYCSLT